MMIGDTTVPAATFSAVAIALIAAHLLADYVIQTDHLAAAKATPGWRGRLACASHVAHHIALSILGVWLLQTLCVTAIPDAPQAYAALALIAVTHYLADRRTPLLRLARLTGKREWMDRGGLPVLDQVVHALALIIAAALIATT